MGGVEEEKEEDEDEEKKKEMKVNSRHHNKNISYSEYHLYIPWVLIVNTKNTQTNVIQHLQQNHVASLFGASQYISPPSSSFSVISIVLRKIK